MTDITELTQSLKAAAEKATPGEWWSDVVETGGTHGSGEDCMEGFHSYAVYDQNNHSLLDMTNSTAAVITVEDDGDYVMAWDEVARRNAEFITLANPANILALVEALEKSEKTSEARREAIDITHKRAARERDRANAAEEALEKAQAKNALVAGGIEAATKLHERIAELDAELEREREKSRRVMSRIAELESRTVTVKLPPAIAVEDWMVDIDVYEADLVRALLKAAGIKWEAE